MNNKIALISLYGVENTGIRSISSVLQKHGFETYLIFFKRWLNNDIRLPLDKEKELLLSLLKDLGVGIVGFTFTSPFLKIAQELTRLIKDNLGIVVIWGGIHATVMPVECLEYCDIVCRGEGEGAMLDVANASINNRSLAGLKNISFKGDGRVISGEVRPLIGDIDSLPFLDYDSSNKFLIEKDLRAVDPLVYSRELRVLCSRGCPFNCSYCYNSILRRVYPGQNYYRIKSPERVIAEIKHYLSFFKGIKKIKFDDDTFVFPRDWISRFAEGYRDSINLPFEILFNADCTDKENLRKLKGAGLIKVQAGIESGSEYECSNIYNRNLSTEKITSFARIAKELGLNVTYDIILDNPLATFNDKRDIINFLLRLPRPFDLFLYSLTVFPGTALYENFLAKGLIKPEDVEGQANKSFYQYRLSFSYPRSKEEQFIAYIVSLTPKSFVPKSLIVLIMKNSYLRKHPILLKWFAIVCNQVKLLQLLIKMVLRGEINFWKFQEYGLPKRFLIQ